MSNRPDNKRYLYLCAGIIVMHFLGLIYAWSIFRAPFAAMFPIWAASDLSLAFTISMVCFCFGGFFSGRLSGKMKRSYIVLTSAALAPSDINKGVTR